MFSLCDPLGCDGKVPAQHFALMGTQFFRGCSHELGELLVIVCGPVFSAHPGNLA